MWSGPSQEDVPSMRARSLVSKHLLETREATRRCDAAPVVSSRSLGWVIPRPGKVGFESCRLVHGMCDFWEAWHRGLFLEGTWPELPSYCYGFQRARRREGAVASHLALVARCRHESISLVDESLDMANYFGSQPRLRGIDRFFFNTSLVPVFRVRLTRWKTFNNVERTRVQQMSLFSVT